MSSFTNLRASRQSKDSRSHVKSSPNFSSSSNLHVLQSPVEGEASFNQALYSLPSQIDIRPSQNRGRGLWSKTDFRSGEVLLFTKPNIAVLSSQYLNLFCSNCFQAPEKGGLKRCTICRTISYCNAQCQTKDWAFHKPECLALQEWAKLAPSPELAVPSDAIRCLGRLIWGRQRNGSTSAWSTQIDKLQSHRASLQSSSFELHAHLSHALVRYLGASSASELGKFGLESAKDLVDIISRFISNTFSVTTPSLTPIGASVSPVVALINHSCEPNAAVVFPGNSNVPSAQEPSMHVVALRAIKPDEEILISYIDTTIPKILRQKSLNETYNFDCRCQLCDQNSVIDLRESVSCPKSCGGICPLPTEDNSLCLCTKCRTPVKNTDAIIDAVRVGQEGLDKATALQFKDPDKARQLTTNLIPILISVGLMPSSHPLLALSRLHQSLLVDSLPLVPDQGALDDTIRAATRANTGVLSILPDGHPIRGIALAELGKLLAVDEPAPKPAATPAEMALIYPPSGPPRLKLAYETLKKARNELLIGFGTKNDGGQVGRDIRETIIALEREIGIWQQGVRNVVEDSRNAGPCKA